MLNGGVVLYEVSRMRRTNYTRDTVRAAYLGKERGYSHFCAWDQDILNVMHSDLWDGKGVRLLPCEWSLFPVTSWQPFWNTPNYWPKELVQNRRYPGLLFANHVEHFCPDELQLLLAVFAFRDPDKKALMRDVALVKGSRNRKKGASVKAVDGTSCACAQRVSLLHVPSTMKLWPWAIRLFQHHTPPFLRPNPPGSAFKSRSEQGAELGGGFWGGEDNMTIDATGIHFLMWGKNNGDWITSGKCATFPTSQAQYQKVDFNSWIQQTDLLLTVETNRCRTPTSFWAPSRHFHSGLARTRVIS